MQGVRSVDRLADLHKIDDKLKANSVQLVVVSMSEEGDMLDTLKSYKLPDAIAVSDPEKQLYAHFQFSSGGMSELMSPKVMWLGMKACIFEGHGVGKKEGDIRQMPGVIVLKNEQVLNRFEHKTAADRPDYLQLVEEAIAT
ncbi:MAG: AhpC/TSA family protein [Planctomycetaceae bacterium]